MSTSVWPTTQSVASVAAGVGLPSPAATMASAAAAAGSVQVLPPTLGNVLGTMGDAQYWEETISPSTIRNDLSTADPSNPNSTPTLLKCMKWLLAQVSKGRNVSDFFPLVVKCVGTTSLEVRKMVYLFVTRYANESKETRHLALLSINAFQRGLADAEQLIRALALRVMTHLEVPDILQIQILAVEKCTRDKSPYVRKCAANAITKLYGRVAPSDDAQQEVLLGNMLQHLLDNDSATMVLTSAVICWNELVPSQLERLHGCYRKLCHLLTDMDEWGQVVVMDALMRYCRCYFREPTRNGSAEVIDAQRRLTRSMGTTATTFAANDMDAAAASGSLLPPHPNTTAPRKVKRRVVKQGFYSDEEDCSTEEEVIVDNDGHVHSSFSSALRQTGATGNTFLGGGSGNINPTNYEDGSLAKDHQLLLRSSLPLLKSRNAAVVLGVCSLHYYCGVGSIAIRSALGKALTRIHRNRREMQFVVLTSIQVLVRECPSAFSPFLHDFLIKATDPIFTRLIKLDILTNLTLDPPSIETILKEMRLYVRGYGGQDETDFCVASVQALGRVVERTRMVHDRYAVRRSEEIGDDATMIKQRERQEANVVALNTLYGLTSLTLASKNARVVGEACMTMQRILLLLQADAGLAPVEDPNQVQDRCRRRLISLLLQTLSAKAKKLAKLGDDDGEDEEEQEEEENEEGTESKTPPAVSLPPEGLSATLWSVGEWLTPVVGDTPNKKLRTEVLRLVCGIFVGSFEPCEKLQGIHLAAKVRVSDSLSEKETRLCESILGMGRVDTNTDVRDRARLESALVHASVGLKFDKEALASSSMGGAGKLNANQARKVLLKTKPPTCSLPLEDDATTTTDSPSKFRFGTLSSLVGSKAGDTYLALPTWASKDSDPSLRESKKGYDINSPTSIGNNNTSGGWKTGNRKVSSGFYDSDSDGGSSSSSSDDSDTDSDDEASGSSSGSDSDDSEKSESEEEDSESESDDSDDGNDNLLQMHKTSPPKTNGGLLASSSSSHPSAVSQLRQPTVKTVSLVDDASSEDEEDEGYATDSSSDDSSDDNLPPPRKSATAPPKPVGNLLDMPLPVAQMAAPAKKSKPPPSPMANGGGRSDSYSDSLQGLVMAPVVVDDIAKQDPNWENDTSEWFSMVRPELGGGLSIRARYVRAPTKLSEAQALGLDPESAAVIVLQLQVENKRTDGGVLRRVRVISRTVTGSGIIGPRTIKVPLEIAALKKGQASLCMLGVAFKGTSDKEGAMHAKIEIKCDRSSTTIELKPSLGELLLRAKLAKDDFERGMGKLQGFQRITTTVKAPSSDPTSRVLKVAALTKQEDESWNKNKRLAFAGCLPASQDKVFVMLVQEGSSAKLTVCCDHAMATNSVLDTLKRALSQ